MPIAIPNEARGVARADGVTDAPAPGLWEGIAAATRASRADVPGFQDAQGWNAYHDLYRRQVRQGVPTDYIQDVASAINRGDLNAARERIWGMAEQLHRTNPKAWTDVPVRREEWDKQWQARVNAETAKAGETAARAPWYSSLIGGMAASFTDPVTIYTLPIGGGEAGVVKTAVREALLNGVLEAAEQPYVNKERMAQGRPEMTVQERVANVGMAMAAGVVIPVAVKGVEVAGGQVRKVLPPAPGLFDRLEPVVRSQWDNLPEDVRARWDKRDGLSAAKADVLLADIGEAIIGKDRMTEAEADAAVLIRRDADLEDRNPFVPNGAGETAHIDAVVQAMARALAGDGDEPVGRVAVAAAARPAPSRAGYIAAIRQAESSGNDRATAGTSSASGRYQFTRPTFISTYRKVFPNTGLNDAAIWQRRFDGDLQDKLMARLTDDNAAFLRGMGEAESGGNLYVVHFAGQGGAEKLFKAAPDAMAADVLGPAAAKANPWLKKMTVQDLMDWAHGKVGGNGARRAGARTVIEAEGGEAAARAELQRRIDAEDARMDALAREMAGERQFSPAVERALDDGVTFKPFDLPEAGGRLRAPSVSEAVASQLENVAIERARYTKLAELQATLSRGAQDEGVGAHSPYGRAAGELGLHPLSKKEIDQALADLDRQKRDAPVDMARQVETLRKAGWQVDDEPTPDAAAVAARDVFPEDAPRMGAMAGDAAAVPDDLRAVGRVAEADRPEADSAGTWEFAGPEGPFRWNPATGHASGAVPRRAGVDAADVRRWLGMEEPVPEPAPLRGQDESLMQWDGDTAAAQAQVQSVEHDLERVLALGEKAGALPAVRLNDQEDGAAITLADAFEDAKADLVEFEAVLACL